MIGMPDHARTDSTTLTPSISGRPRSSSTMLGACDEAAAMAAWAVSTAIWRKPCASSAATIRLRTAGSSSTTKMSGFTAEFGTALLLIKRNVGGGKFNRKD